MFELFAAVEVGELSFELAGGTLDCDTFGPEVVAEIELGADAMLEVLLGVLLAVSLMAGEVDGLLELAVVLGVAVVVLVVSVDVVVPGVVVVETVVDDDGAVLAVVVLLVVELVLWSALVHAPANSAASTAIAIWLRFMETSISTLKKWGSAKAWRLQRECKPLCAGKNPRTTAWRKVEKTPAPEGAGPGSSARGRRREAR